VKDDSKTLSNIEFGEEIGILEIKIRFLSGSPTTFVVRKQTANYMMSPSETPHKVVSIAVDIFAISCIVLCWLIDNSILHKY